MREVDRQYILRIWKDGQGDGAWRASLKELRAEQVVYFKAPDQLAAFIKKQAAEVSS